MNHKTKMTVLLGTWLAILAAAPALFRLGQKLWLKAGTTADSAAGSAGFSTVIAVILLATLVTIIVEPDK
jgi:hypothetical protein